MSLERFAALTATNHARLYGLYPRKGAIMVGADADIALWDPALTKPIRQADLHHGSDYTPWEGFSVTGWPVRTILRGVTTMLDGAQWAIRWANTSPATPPTCWSERGSIIRSSAFWQNT